MASHAYAISQQGKATTNSSNASLETFAVSRPEEDKAFFENSLELTHWETDWLSFASLTDCVGHTCFTNWRQREVFNGAGAAIKTADQSGQSVVKNNQKKTQKKQIKSKWKMENVVDGGRRKFSPKINICQCAA